MGPSAQQKPCLLRKAEGLGERGDSPALASGERFPPHPGVSRPWQRWDLETQ